MKLLVTGAAGFIGSNFVHYWVKKYPNDQITVLDSLTYASNIENLTPVIKKIKFVEGDINNRPKVSEIMRGIDTVVHFAAESHVDRSVFDPAKYWHTNVHGTLALLEEAQKAGVARFHHISTDEVYGELPLDSNLKFTEKTPYSPRPDNIYALSKAEADNIVLDFCEKTGMYITISNCSNNYGPMQFPEKFIPIIVTNLIDGIKVPVHGDGRNVRDWIHVLDHSSAVDVILQKGKKGETYLVGTNNDRSNGYIANKIVNLFGADDSAVNHVPDRHSNDRRYAIDATKLITELGWKPEITRDDFEDALKDTIEWYKDNQNWWRPLLEKKDTVSDSTGKLTAKISLDRVSGKTKFTFENINKDESLPPKANMQKDFVEENLIRYKIVMKNLANKIWYQNSSEQIKNQIEELGKNPSAFGFVEDLASRDVDLHDCKIKSLVKIEHAGKENGIYGIATWFETENKTGKRMVYGYYSWGMGPKSGSKIILLVKNNEKVTHIGLMREEKFPTGFIEYSLPGGFSNLNEGLLDLLIRYLKTDLKLDVLEGDILVDKIISLGRINPDSGMTNNKPSLYAITAELKNKYKDIGEDEIIEEEEGMVLWPVSKIDDLISKCDDSYLLAVIARCISNSLISI
jgi:dTDP-glucose 4,6-dehydratase